MREFSNLVCICLHFKVKGRDGLKGIFSERAVFPKAKAKRDPFGKTREKAWDSLCRGDIGISTRELGVARLSPGRVKWQV